MLILTCKPSGGVTGALRGKSTALVEEIWLALICETRWGRFCHTTSSEIGKKYRGMAKAIPFLYVFLRNRYNEK
jgi:hypothetical protein